MTIEQILDRVNALMSEWQDALGSEVEILLGGSLVSGLFILDDETDLIDVDVRFLVDDPDNPEWISRIESATGLRHRKTRPVADWPEGTSMGHMIEGHLSIDRLDLPCDVEGCLRNRRYVGWHRFYKQVFSKSELAEMRQRKIELRADKAAYKAFKAEVREEAENRCLARGLVTR